MLKILLIEDEEENVQPVIRHLKGTGLFSEESRVVGFEDAAATVASMSPDVVVLDLLDGGNTADAKAEGNNTLDSIWQKRFCPVVVYSAHPEALAEGPWKAHPFVKMVKKGAESEKAVEDVLREFMGHVESLKLAEGEVRTIYAAVMRDVAPYAFNEIKEEGPRREIIRRAGRRRLAALMDDAGATRGIEPWEIYIFPPIAAKTKLGDILRRKDAPVTDPRSFRIVLTPSCDMANDGERQKWALLANCVPCTDGLKATNTSMKPESIKNFINDGHRGGILPLPAMEGKIPHMMADMKRLEVVALADIGDDGKPYCRIASIDSPFRELVAWAYQSTACRPGLPPRNCDPWAKDLATMKSV
jgi:CheY-like chemotaxis protein